MNVRLYECGSDIVVGNSIACNEHVAAFPRSIHIWRPSDITRGWACRRNAAATGDGLALCWREGESPTDLAWSLADAIAYAREPGRLFIHCVAGHCRSPHMAVLALAARGVDPYRAIGDVTRAAYNSGGLAPAWDSRMLSPILDAVREL
jgi:hypothetical protein